MIKKYLFRLLAVLTMVALYFPIASMLLPSPLNSAATFLFIWIIAIAIFHTITLFSKSILFIYFFILLYFSFSIFVWQDRTTDEFNTFFLRWIMVRQIGFALLGILMITYFLSIKDYYGLALVAISAILFIVLTSLIFIISPTFAENYMQVRGSIKNEGTNSYSFFSSLVFLAPIVVYFIKYKNTTKKIKVFILVLWAITILATALDSRTTAFIMASIFLVIPLVSNTNKSVKLFASMSIILILAFTIFKLQLANSIIHIAKLFVGTTLESRLSDFAIAVEISDFDLESDKTYTSGVRLSLLNESLKSFYSNPLIGGGKSGGHSFWIDILGTFGLVGLIPWVMIIQSQINKNLLLFSANYRPFYILSVISFIVFGIFKSGLQDPQIMVSFFFLVPAFYFLDNIKKKKNNSLIIQQKKTRQLKNKVRDKIIPVFPNIIK